jgi:hypothetical protein
MKKLILLPESDRDFVPQQYLSQEFRLCINNSV